MVIETLIKIEKVMVSLSQGLIRTSSFKPFKTMCINQLLKSHANISKWDNILLQKKIGKKS